MLRKSLYLHLYFKNLKKLYLHIIKSYIGTFVFTFFIAIFILLMQFLWTYVDDFIGKGVGFDVMSKLLFYTSITFVPMALPLAILLSSLLEGSLMLRLSAISESAMTVRSVQTDLA